MTGPDAERAARNVLLSVSYDSAAGRGVMTGATRYAREAGWRLQHSQDRYYLRPIVDGILLQPKYGPGLSRVRRRGVPTVAISNTAAGQRMPHVIVDDEMVGRVAARHLLDTNIRTFVFIRGRDAPYARVRGRGFRKELQQAGATCRSVGEVSDPTLAACLESARDDGAPTIGLFAADDMRAYRVARLAEELGVEIPAQAALVGANNDELICNWARSPLSSVVVPGERIGYEAAALLDRLMDGESAPRRPVLIPPGPAVKRASSDIVAIGDAAVSAALQYMRRHLAEPVGVDDLARTAGVSRRLLERRFRNTLGRTPNVELRRMRVERAQQLMLDTDWTAERIAQETGLSSARYMSHVFKKLGLGRPGEWRKRMARLR
jgi:LacI family transcriptional regulator